MNTRKGFMDYIGKSIKGRSTMRRPIDRNTYVRFEDDDLGGIVHVRLHNTDIISFLAHKGAFLLNSGGWRTVTTKCRMNNFSPAQVWQEKGIWYVEWYGKTYNFEDGMMLTPPVLGLPGDEGVQREIKSAVTGARLRNMNEEKAKFRLIRQINKYSKAYATKFMAGEIPRPGVGDCWLCCFVDAKTGEPMGGGTDHLLSHMSEAECYYVPSLLNTAYRKYGKGTLSMAAEQCIGTRWAEDEEVRKSDLGFYTRIGTEQIAKCIRKYLRSCFELST